MYFEKILCVAALFVSLYIVLKKPQSKIYYSIFLFIPALLLNGVFEGFRWQMFGLYIFLAFLILKYIKYLFTKRKDTTVEINFRYPVIHLCYIILSIILVWLFAVNKIPEPSGEYKVGTLTYDLIDKNRKEIYGDRKGQKRKIRLQIWYPSDSIVGGAMVPWKQDGKVIAQAIPRFMGLPGFLYNHTLLVKSNSFIGLKLSKKKKKFPIVLISHGWIGFRNLHTDLAEMLASHGYIAISIDHTYGAIATVFQNGKIARRDPMALPKRKVTPDFLRYANILVKTFSLDSKLVLNHIEKLASGEIVDSSMDLDKSIDEKKISLFAHRIKISSIGGVGHSTGGGALVRLAIVDKRLKAVFGMDPWIEPINSNILVRGLKVPAVFLRSKQWEKEFNNKNLAFLVKSIGIIPEIYQINETKHQDFSMLYMYEPIIDILGFLGELDSKRNAKIQQDFVLQFFENNLKKRKKTSMSYFKKKYKEVIDVKF